MSSCWYTYPFLKHYQLLGTEPNAPITIGKTSARTCHILITSTGSSLYFYIFSICLSSMFWSAGTALSMILHYYYYYYYSLYLGDDVMPVFFFLLESRLHPAALGLKNLSQYSCSAQKSGFLQLRLLLLLLLSLLLLLYYYNCVLIETPFQSCCDPFQSCRNNRKDRWSQHCAILASLAILAIIWKPGFSSSQTIRC